MNPDNEREYWDGVNAIIKKNSEKQTEEIKNYLKTKKNKSSEIKVKTPLEYWDEVKKTGMAYEWNPQTLVVASFGDGLREASKIFKEANDKIEKVFSIYDKDVVQPISEFSPPLPFTAKELYYLFQEIACLIETGGVHPDLTKASTLAFDAAGAIGEEPNKSDVFAQQRIKAAIAKITAKD